MYVSCIQLCSSHDIAQNLAQTAVYLKQASEQGSKLVLLPETFAWIARNEPEKLRCAKKSGIIFDFLAKQAKRHKLWIIAGSLLCPSQDAEKLYNRCPIFAPDGSQYASYDKIHLFDADLGTKKWQESGYIKAGAKPCMVDIQAALQEGEYAHWKAGISICYDLRFPELYRYYSGLGCNIITVAAAFTVPTGKAHWEILLRARAIENQCYVLASAQWGRHSDGRETYGHSMIIDPWGEVIAGLTEGEGVITAELDSNKLQRIRALLPVLKISGSGMS